MKEKEIIKSEKSPILLAILAIGVAALFIAIIGKLPNSPGFFNSIYYLVFFTPIFLGLMFYIGAIITIIFLILVLAYGKASLTVTNMRVYGIASWGKRVDLPMDKIAAVSRGILGSISVSTSSGVIRFMGIKNNNEIHEEINKLLLERQYKEKSADDSNIKHETTQSTADELKKYKELLDTGVITQEEFDSKKKQLLGL